MWRRVPSSFPSNKEPGLQSGQLRFSLMAVNAVKNEGLAANLFFRLIML